MEGRGVAEIGIPRGPGCAPFVLRTFPPHSGGKRCGRGGNDVLARDAGQPWSPPIAGEMPIGRGGTMEDADRQRGPRWRDEG